MKYRILGSLEVTRNGKAVPLGAYKQRALFALLLINANRVVATDRIIDELWGPDAGPDRQNALWVNVSGLRSALEPDRKRRAEGTILLTRSPGYVLSVDPSDVDAGQFERLALEGRALVDLDPAAASLVLSEALALWKGHALEEFTYESFAQAEIARLDELRLTAVEDRITADLRVGRARQLIGELESLVRQYPLRERLTGHLMLALHRSGRQAEALRAYGALRTRLGEELGLEPSVEMAELEERIVLDDPTLRLPLAGRDAGGRPEPGLSVRGYELREKIGEGSFAYVYRAYQPAVGREVAIKVIRPELANDADFIRRFEAEAKVVASLEHAQIVPLYDYWREPDAAYLVMRLFPAGSLEDVLARGPVPSGTASRLIEQIGAALVAAHSKGVTHGDLKPANVLLDEEGSAHLIDFGLPPSGSPQSTLDMPFAAPEQLEGGDATIQSDVYSLAMLADRILRGATGEEGGPESPLVGPASAVIGRATDPEPESRFPDISSFLEELRAALNSSTPTASIATVAAVNPYKGLRAFEENDTDEFFGRERVVERLLTRLGHPGPQGKLVALVGPSGAGKSSVVKAGVIPAIRGGALPGSDRWFVVAMAAGRQPFEALEAALRSVAVSPPPNMLEQLMARNGISATVGSLLPGRGSQLLLVVDQLEELFSHASPSDFRAFLTAMAETARDPHSQVRVVTTLRADFYDHPLRHAEFGELLRLGTEVITPMTADELERAVVGPAAQLGVSFEPGLVAQIVSDVSGQASALPLMQYALTELFERRSGATITAEAYRELGGVSAALVRRANNLYEGLDVDGRVTTRDVFLRLVSLGEGSDDTRRRALVSELNELGTGPVQEVLNLYGHHRLLSFDRDPVTRGPTAEIAHEALLSEWALVNGWINEARSDIQAQRRLAAAAIDWREREQNPDFLLTGARLSRYSSWLDDPPVQLTAGEAQFLTASVQAEANNLQEAGRQAVRDVKLRRRTLLLGGLALITAIVVGLAGFALNERNRATDLAAEAEDLANEATSLASTLTATERTLRLTTQSALQRGEDPQLGLMLALEAARTTASSGEVLPAAVDAIHWALQAGHIQYPTVPGTDAVVREGPAGLTGLFNLPPDDLIAFAQDKVSRGFTVEECSRFFRNEQCPNPLAAFPLNLAVAGGESVYATHPIGGAGLTGTEVVVTSAFSPTFGAEFVQASLDVIGDATGIEVRHRNPQHGLAVIDVAESTDPGDILILPQPGVMASLAADGILIDVSQYLDVETLRDGYQDYLLALSSVGADGEWPAPDGTPYGVFTNLDAKSLIWSPSPEFENAGYETPETWNELMALSDQMVSDGETPWCLSTADPAVNGWPASDWVETAVLRSQGPEFYDSG